MRKSMFLMPLMAALALTSCSNNEPMAPENFDESFDGQAYMRVRIAMSDGSGTRAAGDFVNGTAEEQAIKDIGLKFYNADGSFYGYGFPVDAQEVVETTTDPNIEGKVKDAIIVLEINSNAPKPTNVVAFVNCGEHWKQTVEPNINDINQEMDGYANTYDGTVCYAMTSSNYRASVSGSVDYAQGYQTIIDPTKFKSTEADAKAEGVPVDIYVERLAAKVKVGHDASMTPAEITAGDYTLNFKIDGYALGATNPKEYYVKHIDSRWSPETMWDGWNDAINHRCFWAADMNYYERNIIPALNFVSYNGVRGSLAASKGANAWLYSTENTQASFGSGSSSPNDPLDVNKAPRFNASNVNRYQFQEFAYVIGHYEVTKNGAPVTDTYLYEYAGKIFPADVMLTYMYQNLSNVVYKRTVAGDNIIYSAVDISEWLKIDSYQNDASLVCLTLKPDDELPEGVNITDYFVKKETATGKDESEYTPIASREDIETRLKQSEIQAYGFKYDAEAGGYLAYFPILIKHLNTAGSNPNNKGEDAWGYYGVVRNHCYNITINKITGLGIGIFDPDVDIIPKDKIKPLYLGATINILSWRVVNQNVDL